MIHTHTVPFTITSAMPTDLGHIPISAEIDFGGLLQSAGLGDRRPDPTSVTIHDLTDDHPVPCHLAQ